MVPQTSSDEHETVRNLETAEVVSCENSWTCWRLSRHQVQMHLTKEIFGLKCFVRTANAYRAGSNQVRQGRQ